MRKLAAALWAANAVALAAGWSIEYSAYPQQDGKQSIYVNGKVRTTKDVAVNTEVLFDAPPGRSYIAGPEYVMYPLYFKHIAYMIQTTTQVEPGISFRDFAVDKAKGVSAAFNKISMGEPHWSFAAKLVASAECDSSIDACQFETEGGEAFYASFNNLYHVLPADRIDKLTTLTTKLGEIVMDARDYNSYIESTGYTVVSIPSANLALWANATHVQLWERPSTLNSMQDMVSMLLMLFALVAIIDISVETTRRFGTASPMTVADATWLTCVVMWDMVTSAAIIIILRVYHRVDFVDVRAHGLRPHNVAMQNGVAVALVSTAALVVTAVVADRARDFLQHKEEWWIWSRSSFETAIVLAAAASAPTIAGDGFILAVRFAVGIVLAVVTGRDLDCAVQGGSWELTFLAAAQSLMILFVISNCLMSPVFWLSQSFPSTRVFIDFLSHAVTIMLMALGAGIAPRKMAAAAVPLQTVATQIKQMTQSML